MSSYIIVLYAKEKEILTYEWFIIWNFISHYYMGESLTAAAIGVVIDGCPAGLSLSESDIQAFWTADVRDRAAIRPSAVRPIR